MSTISTYSNFHSVVLALENTYERLYYVETISRLLKGIESGEIEDDDPSLITFKTIATEALTKVIKGFSNDCFEIQSYLETQGGERFRTLVENAKLQAKTSVDSIEVGGES